MELTIHHAILEGTVQPVNLGILDGKIAVLQTEDLAPGGQAREGALFGTPR